MNIRETVNSFGEDICGRFSPDGACAFVSPGETEGFIDTSADLDGSRGIAFLKSGIAADFDGNTARLGYGEIRETELVDSFESPFADELIIRGRHSDIRVSDCSLNKRFLKLLVDALCLKYASAPAEDASAGQNAAQPSADGGTEAAQPSADGGKDAAKSAPKRGTDAAQTSADRGIAPQNREPASRNEAIEAAQKPFAVPEGHIAVEITEEKIKWISDEPEEVPVIPEVKLGGEDLPETSEALEGMTREQTLSYLVSSLNEINAPAHAGGAVVPSASSASFAADNAAVPQNGDAEDAALPAQDNAKTISPAPEAADTALPARDNADTPSPDGGEDTAPPPDESEAPAESLTVEPESDDIYIKASRKLREICESGRLTRSEITAALKEKLIPAANVFTDIVSGGAEVPEGLAPRIGELKAASYALEGYFALGEDVAERVMFFMMYQMLSYSDRIVETPETKERLNDFFRRYGPSGITLSMLDRVK